MEAGLDGLLWESDLDLVVVLDALAGGPITRALYRAAQLGVPDGPVAASRSVCRECDGRETDVLLRGKTGTLLVENKLEADFQPGQPESYKAEVARLRGCSTAASAVVVCPERHIARHRASAGDCFAGYVAIEDLASELEASAEPDLTARAQVLRHAAAARVRGSTADPVRAAWGLEYRALIAELLPTDQLRVGPKGLASAEALTAWFIGPEVDSTIWGFGHGIVEGTVSVSFYKASSPRLGDPPVGARVDETKKLWSVRIDVPPMSFARSPREQLDEMVEAVAAAVVLREWLRSADVR